MPRTGKKQTRKRPSRDNDDDGGNVASDGRFAHMLHDPRFEQVPSKKNKIAVDERFTGMFESVHTQSAAVCGLWIEFDTYGLWFMGRF